MTIDWPAQMQRFGIRPTDHDARERVLVELGREVGVPLMVRKRRGRKRAAALAYRTLDWHLSRFLQREKARANREGRQVREEVLRAQALRDRAVREALHRAGLRVMKPASARVLAIKGRKARDSDPRRIAVIRRRNELLRRHAAARALGVHGWISIPVKSLAEMAGVI